MFDDTCTCLITQGISELVHKAFILPWDDLLKQKECMHVCILQIHKQKNFNTRSSLSTCLKKYSLDFQEKVLRDSKAALNSLYIYGIYRSQTYDIPPQPQRQTQLKHLSSCKSREPRITLDLTKEWLFYLHQMALSQTERNHDLSSLCTRAHYKA